MTASRLKNLLPAMGRILLSLAVLLAVWGTLSLMAVFHVFINSGSHGGEAIRSEAALPVAPAAAPPKRSALWPQFPVHGAIATHELILNGTPVTIEEWESSSPPKDILAYYEIQMAARGWRDGMKGVRSITDEAVAQLQQNAGTNIPPEMFQSCRANEDSCLDLQCPGWSMSVVVEPSGRSIHQSRVTLMAAPVASLHELAFSLARAGRPGIFEKDAQPLDIVRKSHGERFHTTVNVRNKNPDQALKESVAELRSKGWRMNLSPFRQGRSDYFVWLAKGKQYANLSVKALPNSQSSSVTFTEVTPE